jgi:AcrR family transcriptional regulator
MDNSWPTVQKPIIAKTQPVPTRPRQSDRRVVRTREALRDALLALMVVKAWDEIDVVALCEQANIGRSTFYLHFANKEALLDGSLDALGDLLRDQAGLRQDKTEGRLAFADGLVEHVHEQQAVFRAIVGRRSASHVQGRFRELLVRLVSEEVGAAGGPWQRAATARYLAGALYELMSWWLGSRRAHRPQEIIALFHALSGAALGVTR